MRINETGKMEKGERGEEEKEGEDSINIVETFKNEIVPKNVHFP